MHNFLNFILHVFGREKKIFFIVLYTSSLLSMHDQSLLDKYCPPEIKQLIIYFTLVSEKIDELERYKELQKRYRPVSLISKEFHKYSEKILFVLCNDIIDALSKKPSDEKDTFIKQRYKLFKQISEETTTTFKYNIYPAFIHYYKKQSLVPLKTKYKFLKLASIYDSDRIAKFLLKDKNLNLNKTDEDGVGYLTTAIIWNSYNVAKLLLQSDTNVNIQDNDNQSPLWQGFHSYLNVAGGCDLKLIELLLQYKANMHQICRNNETVYKAVMKYERFFDSHFYNKLIALFEKYDKKTDVLQ